jgi:hypothetical protein
VQAALGCLVSAYADSFAFFYFTPALHLYTRAFLALYFLSLAIVSQGTSFFFFFVCTLKNFMLSLFGERRASLAFTGPRGKASGFFTSRRRLFGLSASSGGDAAYPASFLYTKRLLR